MNKVDEIKTNEFPYLDMKLFWNDERTLECQVYRKPNQRLKYLKKGSVHAPYTFAAIPHGIIRCLA